MKKVLSFSALLGILLSTMPAVSAQRSDAEKPSKAKELSVVRADRQTVIKETTEFGKADAISSGSGTLLTWDMKVESANLGFKIYRTAIGGRVQVDNRFIMGSFGKVGRSAAYGETYSYFDRKGDLSSIYEIESQNSAGEIQRLGPITTRSGRVKVSKETGIPGMDPEPGTFSSAEKLSLPAEVTAEITSPADQTDAATHAWVMSQPGVRIDVKKEGIYRVSFSQLQAAGFDINSDPNNWQLYVRGVQQAISVSVASTFIEFFGKGVDTQETDIQGYFLVNGATPGKRMATAVARPPGASVPQSGYDATYEFRSRSFFVAAILNGPNAGNYFGDFIPSLVADPQTTGLDIPFDMSGIDLTLDSAVVDVKLQGYSPTLHRVKVSLNGQFLGNIDGVSQFSYGTSFNVPTSLLKDKALGQGSNTLNLVGTNSAADSNLFDSIKVSLKRKHRAENGTLHAYTLGNKVPQLRGFSSANVRVFNITNEDSPVQITDIPFYSIEGSFGTDLTAGRPKVIFAVEDSAILVPVNIQAHDGEALGSTEQAAQLVIISYKAFLAQANAWAAYRTTQGFSVKVIDVDEITNEFNYGALSSDAIESFLQYAYTNWTVKPSYVLLIGDASYDSRNYEGVGFFNYVPSRIVTTVSLETASDDSLADFNNDGLAEIPIGRIPARTTAQVTTALNKVINWETNLMSNPLGRGALFAYDQPNGYDFKAMSERLRDEITWPAGVTPTMVDRLQPGSQANLMSGLNTGKYIVNYSGHGSSGAWFNSSFFWLLNVLSLTNQNNESVFTMLTCLNGYFHSLNAVSLGEFLLFAENGGAVAAWASSGETTASVQEIMGRRFYKKVGEGQLLRLGDLVNDAKSALVTQGSDVRLSWVLLGDPMLKVR